MDWQTETQGALLIGRQHGRVDESNWQAFSDHLVAAITATQAAALRFVRRPVGRRLHVLTRPARVEYRAGGGEGCWGWTWRSPHRATQ